ncbi:MAG: type VI secretion system tube protein Hcp [Verrucomicrobia bacterium]|nr:type VI secretion system tube protein Hcp [Verrucomicrobiota bacterium]
MKGREGLPKLLAYSHEITSPRDPASGQATGRRQHEPFRIVKHVNRASPGLLATMARNESLKSVTIDIWAIDRFGAERKIITYTLKNAQIVSLRSWMPNKSDTSAAGYPPAEEVAFVYEKIEVTWHDGGVKGEDDWFLRPQ